MVDAPVLIIGADEEMPLVIGNGRAHNVLVCNVPFDLVLIVTHKQAKATGLVGFNHEWCHRV